MTDVEKLKEARALIVNGWTKFAPARDEDSRPVTCYDPLATRFCALGACHRVGADENYLYAALGGDRSISDFNDSSAQADVLALYDRAIALAEQEVNRGA